MKEITLIFIELFPKIDEEDVEKTLNEENIINFSDVEYCAQPKVRVKSI